VRDDLGDHDPAVSRPHGACGVDEVTMGERTGVGSSHPDISREGEETERRYKRHGGRFHSGSDRQQEDKRWKGQYDVSPDATTEVEDSLAVAGYYPQHPAYDQPDRGCDQSDSKRGSSSCDD